MMLCVLALPCRLEEASQQGRKAQQQQGAPTAAATKGEVVTMAVPWEAGQTGQLGLEQAGGRLPPAFPGRFVFHDEEVGLGPVWVGCQSGEAWGRLASQVAGFMGRNSFCRLVRVFGLLP